MSYTSRSEEAVAYSRSRIGLYLLGVFAAWPAIVAADARVSDVRLSPNGSRIVAIQAVGGDRVAVVADLLSGQRSVAARGGSHQQLDACDWVTDDRLVCSVFVFPSRSGFPGDERRRLVRLLAVDHDGSEPRTLLSRPPRRTPKFGGGLEGAGIPQEDLEHALVSRLSDNPDHVLVAASRQAMPYTSVYRVDIHDGTPRLAVRWQPGILFWHADWQGRVRVGTGAYAFGPGVPLAPDEPRIGPTAVALAGLPDSDARGRRLDVSRLSSPIGSTEVAGPRVLGFGLDGRRVYYTARVDGADLASLWEADAGTLAPVRELIADPERDVVAAAIGAEECGTAGLAHGRGIAWLDPRIGSAVAEAATELAREVVHVPSMSADCRRLVLASSDQTTVLFHLLDRDTGRLRYLGGQQPRGEAAERTVRREDRFPTRDSLQLPVALTLPEGMEGAALPIVVLLDYDRDASSDPAILDDAPVVFASRGYVVAQPAFRGSQGFGVANHLAGLGQRGLKLQQDVADAVGWLASEGLGDAQRVCFAGRGRGGHMAVAAALGYAPPDPSTARLCVAALAALEARHTKRATHNPLDARVCGWFPCGDWMRWAAPDRMRAFARRVSTARPAKDSLLRSPVVGATHPGFPILVHVDGRGTVHDRYSARFRSDLAKLGFFEHLVFTGSHDESAFIAEAQMLFDEVLGGRETGTGASP